MEHPNNISDIMRFIDDNYWLFIKQEDTPQIKELLRSQIEQLLERIDTKKENYEVAPFSPDYDPFHKTLIIGRNQKSSEIANQIELMKL